MTTSSPQQTGGHLQYYEQHGISPVRYSAETLDSHFGRRDALYRSLGLPPAAFRGARVLEVAPGSGQNSLYVAACMPQALDLVEPNPAGLRDIEAHYAGLDRPHTEPVLHRQRFEAFAIDRTYDIVLCENWLGSLPNEVALIRKLSSLVAPGGVLVLTVVPLSGFFPNVMRKLLALRLVDPKADFESRTRNLTDVFGPHLATIANMTRSHRDWVQDCMLNPHYLNVALALETVLEAIGGEMETLATFPRFASDWRWFKGLTGAERNFNSHMLTGYRQNLHNFIDYRVTFPERSSDENAPLDAAFHALHEAALAWQSAAADGATDLPRLTQRIGEALGEIAGSLSAIDARLGAAAEEVRTLWLRDDITSREVADMQHFASLFGRETVYVSLTRPRDV